VLGALAFWLAAGWGFGKVVTFFCRVVCFWPLSLNQIYSFGAGLESGRLSAHFFGCSLFRLFTFSAVHFFGCSFFACARFSAAHFFGTTTFVSPPCFFGFCPFFFSRYLCDLTSLLLFFVFHRFAHGQTVVLTKPNASPRHLTTNQPPIAFLCEPYIFGAQPKKHRKEAANSSM